MRGRGERSNLAVAGPGSAGSPPAPLGGGAGGGGGPTKHNSAVAATTSRMARISRVTRFSPRMMIPPRAAIAGSRLMSTPNTPAGMRLQRLELEQYGIADERTADGQARLRGPSRPAGSSLRRPLPPRRTTRLPTIMASAPTPGQPGSIAPTLTLRRMYNGSAQTRVMGICASSARATPLVQPAAPHKVRGGGGVRRDRRDTIPAASPVHPQGQVEGKARSNLRSAGGSAEWDLHDVTRRAPPTAERGNLRVQRTTIAAPMDMTQVLDVRTEHHPLLL